MALRVLHSLSRYSVFTRAWRAFFLFPSFLFFSSLFIYLFLSSFSVEHSLFFFFSNYIESMYRSAGVCLRDTGIGRERERGRERSGKEGPDDSLENSLSWEWHFHKYLWKQKTKNTKASAPLSSSCKTKEVLLIKMATSYYCHTHRAWHPETHDNHMNAVAIWNTLCGRAFILLWMPPFNRQTAAQLAT